MGFMRKALLLGTAGLAPVKANSKKERTAKAAEKQVRLQEQMLGTRRARSRPRKPKSKADTPPRL
ncbi:MAG: hypothetical protein ACLP1Q_19240, partial [Solirubrobacteraceae bacterium]